MSHEDTSTWTKPDPLEETSGAVVSAWLAGLTEDQADVLSRWDLNALDDLVLRALQGDRSFMALEVRITPDTDTDVDTDTDTDDDDFDDPLTR